MNPAPNPSSLKVVIAEDNAVNAAVLKAVLKQMGVVPVITGNGVELLEEMNRASYDLVLMDISMPRMDGYDATLRIRAGDAGEQHRNIPIIAITALGESESRRTCMDVGMDDLLTKPVTPNPLNEAIRKVFQSRQSVNAS